MKRFYDFLLPERTHLKAVIAALIAIFLLSGVLAYEVHRSEMQRVKAEAEQAHSYEVLAAHSMAGEFDNGMIRGIIGAFKGGMLPNPGQATHADIRKGFDVSEMCRKCKASADAGPLYEIDLRHPEKNSSPIPSAILLAIDTAQTAPLLRDTFDVGAVSIGSDSDFEAYAFMRDTTRGEKTAWVFHLPRSLIEHADSVVLADTKPIPVQLMHEHKADELFQIEARAHDLRLGSFTASAPSLGDATSQSGLMLPALRWYATMLPYGRRVLFPTQKEFLSPGWLVAVMAAIACVILMAIVLVRREEELYRLRSDLISGVSHELRTPLAQIRMFAETLLLGRTRTEAERRRSLEIIDQEAKRLSHFVDNMLQFAKGEGGRTKLAPEPTSFAVEVRRAVEGFAPMCQARGVEVRTELEEGVTAAVDRAALRRIMLNLMENALKYGPDEQRITVGVALFDDVVRLWVDDEGEGIPRGDRERVFDSFYRLSRELDRRITGSGIGLAVVRQLATLHNGRSWAEEAPGGGARLVVEFPDAYVRPPEEGTGWAVA